MSSLVVVLVAQEATLGVQDVPDGDVGLHALGGELGLDGQRGGARPVGIAADGCGPHRRLVLPRLPGPVDESVVHEEERVARRGDGIGHDRTGTVVAVGVRAALDAGPQVVVGRARYACVDVRLVDVRCR